MKARVALRVLAFVTVVIAVAMTGCGSKAATCVEGATATCACPSGSTGAQVCSASGAYGPCSCTGSGVASEPVSNAGSVTEGSTCSVDALGCSQYSAGGKTGMSLHELVYKTRLAGRYAEAICLAQANLNGSTDTWLLGASHYEVSYAWEGLGCRTSAVVAIEGSLRERPSDKNGWKETCARCAELKANCKACEVAKTERIACPSMSQLAADVGAAMLARAPSDTTWTAPTVEMCIPIALPQPGWYVIGWVQQDSPDREFWFHLAVDARTSKVLAISEEEQRKYNYACETKFGKVVDRAGAPSRVLMRVDCQDKMENTSGENLEAEIVPPKIVLHTRK